MLPAENHKAHKNNKNLSGNKSLNYTKQTKTKPGTRRTGDYVCIEGEIQK